MTVRWLWAALLCAQCLGCEEKPEDKTVSAPKARQQAIMAKPDAATPATTVRQSNETAPKEPRKKLCEGQFSQRGKKLSTTKLGRYDADGEQTAAALPQGTEFLWINFWAAWCVPCREEIPRLKEWQRELGASGKLGVAFVSLDDDTRQLKQFLGQQGSEGLQHTFWLKEGGTREEWLAQIELEPDPELPLHVIADKQGNARCVIRGAVEDADLPALKELVGG